MALALLKKVMDRIWQQKAEAQKLKPM